MLSKVLLLSPLTLGYIGAHFHGLPLEEDAWNICVINDGGTVRNLVVLGSYKKEYYAEAKVRFDNLGANISSCGTNLILCEGSYQVDPDELDDKGVEVPDCEECGNCPVCSMWEEYFKYCEES